MTTDELALEIGQIFDQELLPLIKMKNLDYAGFDDALKVFREYGSYGILVRLGDKYSRLKTLMAEPRRPIKEIITDEKIEDTVKDFLNYGLLLLICLREGM